jgi:hypothetical protein
MTADIKDYLNSLIIEYITEVIDVEVDAEGVVVKERLGVTRILDPLLLRELLKFTPKLNVDRVISFGLTLAMAKSMNGKSIIVSSTEDARMKDYFKSTKNRQLFRTSRNPFRY